MKDITENQNQIDGIQDLAVSLELDILLTQEQMQSETDETHITFLTDYLEVLKYELDKVNGEIYLSRQKRNCRKSENVLHGLKSETL